MQAGGGVYAPDRLTCRNSVCVGRFRVLERPVFYVRKGTKMDRICTIEDCKGPLHARKYCGKHYERWRKHGDPLAGGTWYATAEEAFAARVAWDGACLIWIGGTTRGGYGTLSVNGRMVRAHRFAWERENGPTPGGLFIDHACHTPACVFPGHLRTATPGENAANLRGARRGRAHDLPRGVSRNGKGYVAQVGHNGVRHGLGTYATPEEASAAAEAKRMELFGEYAGRA